MAPSASEKGIALSTELTGDAHGGEIWVDRTSKEGSVFCFTLPVS
jgi:signal transduction histidine kinase